MFENTVKALLPRRTPIGLQLARTAKLVGRSFNDELTAAGGSLPTWLILSALLSTAPETQHDVAQAVGIEGPTLTRHLDQLEQAGLVRRARSSDDRRAVRVELTSSGRRLHAALLEVVIAFNRRLTQGLDSAELEALRSSLGRLEANVRATPPV